MPGLHWLSSLRLVLEQSDEISLELSESLDQIASSFQPRSLVIFPILCRCIPISSLFQPRFPGLYLPLLYPAGALPTMIILDEKMALPPPPPYAPPEPVSPPPFPYQSKIVPTLATLPPNILLHVVYATFGDGETIERQRQTLYWLNTSLRAVCRTLYVGEYSSIYAHTIQCYKSSSCTSHFMKFELLP